MVSVTRIKESSDRKRSVYLVTLNGREVGLLEKLRNTRSYFHPWKAFGGVGMPCKFLGAFYPEEGGRAAALACVLAGLPKAEARPALPRMI